MSEYLILAETVIYKNDKLTCINIYNQFRTVAMPAEIRFDMAVICGPNWEAGEHKISIKARANNGKEVLLGSADVKIPDKDFVYNAYMNDIKMVLDYSVKDITMIVYDDKNAILINKYPVIPMLVPQGPNVTEEVKNTENKVTENKETEKNTAEKQEKPKKEKVKA